jgi:hypothetical protein
MEILIGIALFLGLTIAIVLILRWIGAWMLRIDDFITLIK